MARSNFDLYVQEGVLYYVKDSCEPVDIEARFFLHIVPVDKNDLPAGRVQHGFDNLDFYFNDRGGRLDDRCMASVDLVQYDIDRIRTGQFTDEGKIWDVGFAPEE